MKQGLGVSATLVFVVFLVVPLPVLARVMADSTQGLTIKVGVYNWAKVPQLNLEKSQIVATEVFKEAGIELKWLTCPCEPLEPPNLSLRIIPKLFGSTRSTFRRDHLGFAAVSEDGGVLATVFFDRVEAAGKGGDLSGVLGLATAHELGHLLLGSRAHSDDGIMQPRWTRQNLRQAHRRSFRFNSAQSQTIRQRASSYQGLANGIAGSVANAPSPIEPHEVTQP